MELVSDEKHVLLFSGGIDSFCARRYLTSGRHKGWLKYLYFDLGTPYTKKEVEYVKKVEPGIIIDDSLRFLGETQIGSKAFVPYRNVFLAMRAASLGFERIWIAGVKDDQVNDKSEVAFLDFSAFLSRYSIEGQVVRISSPFWHLTKAEVIHLMLEKQFVTREDLLSTVACYSEEDTNYCGKCNCCFRKWIALRANGIQQDFHNEAMIEEYYQKCKSGQYDETRARTTIKIIEDYRSEQHVHEFEKYH